MKCFLFLLARVSYKYYLLIIVSIMIIVPYSKAQTIYSDDELLQMGTNYYHNNKYALAQLYLFAYVQRNSRTYQTDSDFKSQVDAALQYAANNSFLPGARGNFMPPPLQRDANGHIIPKVEPAKPTINYSSVPANSEPVVKLRTGMYTCDDGGIYYITVIKNEMWCYGTTYDNTRGNVIHGYISGNEITTTWADVPCCNGKNFGTATLKINDSEDFSIENQTGGFTGNVWKLVEKKTAKKSVKKNSSE